MKICLDESNHFLNVYFKFQCTTKFLTRTHHAHECVDHYTIHNYESLKNNAQILCKMVIEQDVGFKKY